jgi:hypothetical protein
MEMDAAQDLATRLVKHNAWIIRCSYVMDDQHDGYNNGVAGACEDTVCMAFEFTRHEAREYMRIVAMEV